jgi:hypothetical protein
MKSIPILMLLLVSASGIVFAADALVIPAGSPFKIRTEIGDTGAPIEFSGEATVSGTFQVEWALIDDAPEELIVSIAPDDQAKAQFPYAVDAPVQALIIRNPDEAVKLLLGDILGSEVLARRVLRVEGRANMLASGLRSSIDCNQRSYQIHVISVSSSVVFDQHGPVVRRGGC